MKYYSELITGELRLSSKALRQLAEEGIYEFQWNIPKAGLYDVSIYREHQTDDIIMLMTKKCNDHLFSFIIPPHLREIRLGKEEISLRLL
jgi:hypothetical protein